MGLETTLKTGQIIHNFNRLANYRGHEAKMHENEATPHEAENEAEANNYEAENEVKAVKFGLEADLAWDLTSLVSGDRYVHCFVSGVVHSI